MTSPGGFGRPDSLRALADATLRDHSTAPSVLALHLRAAAERIDRHETTRAAEAEREESRVKATVARAIRGVQVEAVGSSFDPRGYFVYGLWGRNDNCPLYVGQSTNILSRLGAHIDDPTKRPLVERVTVTRCPTAARMHTLEKATIREYLPPWNRQLYLPCKDGRFTA